MATQPESLNVGDPARTGNVSRRDFVRGGLTGAAAISLTSATRAHAQLPGVRGPVSRDEIVLLVNHATQGFNLDELALARSMGYDGWLEYQLDYENIDDSELEQTLQGLSTLEMTGQQLFDNYTPPAGAPQTVVAELRTANLLRAVRSKRQLFERMVEFWTDHFSVHHTDGFIQLLKTVEDREVIREHALGNFRDLLHADARSAAMSDYLDNSASTAGNINENYARELLELHTLGVDGPYTETDVVEVARALTGWRFLQPQTGNFGAFIFQNALHDQSPKVVLGKNMPANNGINDGNAVLDCLATHPSTADFVSRKMTSWLLGYEPPRALVDEVAAVFLATGGEIKDMVRTIFARSSLALTNPWVNRKHKRPYHFIVGLVRQTGATINAFFPLIQELGVFGQTPYDWPAPNGYPDSIGAWGSAVLARWTFASRMLDNQIPGLVVSGQDLVAIAGGVPASGLAQRVNHVLTGGAMSRDDVAKVQSFIDAAPLSGGRFREAIALAASSPSYSFY